MPTLIRAFGLAAVCTILLSISFTADAEHHEDQKAILVTGATSGIGLNIAKRLASNGYFVYAGARKQADIDRLNKIDNIEAIRLDVTVQDDIDAAVRKIQDDGRGLYGLVNNAGVFIGGPITEVGIDETEWLFDVNVFGVYRVTQAFAPMIIEQKGRITTIGSISGTLSGTFFSQYSMSKHAMEAFTDALAREMARFDVQVSVIEPGNYDSKIVASAYERMIEKGYIKDDSPYVEDLKSFMQWPADRSIYKAPDEVADAAMHALFDEQPLLRYMVVPNEGEANRTVSTALRKAVQLNTWQEYSYTREELIAMLDEAMSETAK